ncbi:DUF4489 domain-containing protein [Wukongibacter baidiensis]|uniref:DUF4489 domain-containing protein n=1 Tax=Wukongibacter baidiensis TaxID=1723361 RepID=UPI003D7F933D
MTYNSHYQDYKSCGAADDFAKCKSKHLKPQKILLECGQGAGNKTFTSPDDVPFQIAHVIVNTTCLSKTEILIKFSSLVRLERLIDDDPRTVKLKYELFRTCNGEEPISLGTWMFEKADTFQNRFNRLEESFSFIFCEKSNCLGCCVYFVKVTPVEITNSTATVSTGQMAALTEELCPILEGDCKRYDSTYENTGFRPTHIKSKDTILACGQGNGGIVFKEMGLPIPADIAHVTIDMTRLVNPKALIEFSCIIKLSEDLSNALFKFELFRMCGDSEPASCGIWTFETRNSDELINKAFSFIFCECEASSKHCEYFVRVIPIEVDASEDDDVTIYNARMSAVAQSSNKKSYCNNCKQSHDKSKEILLECGSGAGSRTFTSASEVPFQIAHVTLDTTFFCKPIVNIEFSNIVSFELVTTGTDQEVSLQFRYELFRKCDNKSLISLGVWEFSVTNEHEEQVGGTIEGSESFDFTFCECMADPGCCDYFVTVTAVDVLEGPGISSVGTVSDASIAALAGEAW